MLGVLLELLQTNKKRWFMKSYDKGNGKESNRIQLLSLHTFANTTKHVIIIGMSLWNQFYFSCYFLWDVIFNFTNQLGLFLFFGDNNHHMQRLKSRASYHNYYYTSFSYFPTSSHVTETIWGWIMNILD